MCKKDSKGRKYFEKRLQYAKDIYFFVHPVVLNISVFTSSDGIRSEEKTKRISLVVH